MRRRRGCGRGELEEPVAPTSATIVIPKLVLPGRNWFRYFVVRQVTVDFPDHAVNPVLDIFLYPISSPVEKFSGNTPEFPSFA